LYDFDTGEKISIYENKSIENTGIIDILFTQNSKELYFSNNSVWFIDLLNKELQKFNISTVRKGGLCGGYDLDEFSPDGSSLIFDLCCMGPLSRYIVNIDSQEVRQKLSIPDVYGYGYINMVTFLGNKALLGYRAEDVKEINVYSVNGNLVKSLFEISYDDQLVVNDEPWLYGSYISLLKRNDHNHRYFDGNFYSINEDTYETELLPPSTDILVSNRYDGAHILWLVDINFGSPVFIDKNINYRFISAHPFSD